jgi:hypothetical protein
MPQKTVHNSLPASQFRDSLSSMHTDTSLTDVQRAAIQNGLQAGYAALGADGRNLGKSLFGSYSVSSSAVTLFVSVA